MRYLILAAAAMATMAACGGGDDKPVAIPSIEVRDGQRIVTSNSQVNVRPDTGAYIQVGNVGNGPLQIKDISIESTPAGAFTITSLPQPTATEPVVVAPQALAHQFQINYMPSAVASGERASAVVRIRTNLTINSGELFSFTVQPEAVVARLVVSPPILNFTTTTLQTVGFGTSNLLNTGSAPLSIARFIFGGHTGYSAKIADVVYNVTAETAATGVVLNPPLVIPAGSTLRVEVTYTSTGPEAATGKMVFFTTDPTDTGSQLELFANVDGPCIAAKPSRIAFGAKPVAASSEIGLDIESCGDVDLVISDIEMIEDANGQFAVTEAALGAFPVTVPAGQTVTLPVTFFPAAAAVLGVDGQFVLETGAIKISSNAFVNELTVPVDGFGASSECPIANITVAEGDEVLPQTNLSLSGATSTAVGGAIVGYEWTVLQPNGSVSTFIPSNSVVAPRFEANIVGPYIFRLNVVDSFGNRSCTPAEVTVAVTSDDAIHVELLWDTPGDPNQSDVSSPLDIFSAGSDVDLHFLSPKANGSYFGSYDCYFANPNPEWGIFSPSDNPRLDRDDTDGAGPENLNVDVPEQGVRYQVGAHYYDDWGYGDSKVTMKVYIYGILRDQWDNVWMTMDDMWDSHYIDWPSGTVTRIGNTPRITPNYYY